MSTIFQYPAYMTRQHSAPSNSRIEYRGEIQRLREANSELSTEAQELRERISYLENLAVSWADQYATSQHALADTQSRADNAINTWLVTRTWLDEAQASLTVTQRELADTRNELNQAKIERNQLQHALADQTRATTDAVNAERTARQEVASLNDRLVRVTPRWAELVDRVQNEAIGRQIAEQALAVERQQSHEARETVTQVIAEKVDLEANLEMVREKNVALVEQLQQIYNYLDSVESALSKSKILEGIINSSTASSTTSSPPSLTDSDNLTSSEPSPPTSPLPATDAEPFSQVELDSLTADLEEEGFILMGEDPEEITVPSFPPFVHNPPAVFDSETGLIKRQASSSHFPS
ncbi:hypothetical protein BDY19DRAFT_908052 [Irpex rosettiformis]|uniref:Uncharacterized protein n=1 Tax=Irpex rosettiformis TaxID=378272 RepID=A0ACB8TX84_9APHY|nr:hypothetical protein BDY19DRAFT_908052 [Irpex rosettiformis]